ncbi:MAG: hypothetical protein C4589_04440, partial [Peptococcaceae bacterium]
MQSRVNFYLITALIVGTVLWVITMTVSGVATFSQVVFCLLNFRVLPWAFLVIAFLLFWFNRMTLPALLNHREDPVAAQRALLYFPVVGLICYLCYALIGSILAVTFEEWGRPLTIALGICAAISAVFVYLFPFFILAVETIETEFGELAFSGRRDHYFPLATRVGVSLFGLIIGAAGTLGV